MIRSRNFPVDLSASVVAWTVYAPAGREIRIGETLLSLAIILPSVPAPCIKYR